MPQLNAAKRAVITTVTTEWHGICVETPASAIKKHFEQNKSEGKKRNNHKYGKLASTWTLRLLHGQR